MLDDVALCDERLLPRQVATQLQGLPAVNALTQDAFDSVVRQFGSIHQLIAAIVDVIDEELQSIARDPVVLTQLHQDGRMGVLHIQVPIEWHGDEMANTTIHHVEPSTLLAVQSTRGSPGAEVIQHDNFADASAGICPLCMLVVLA